MDSDRDYQGGRVPLPRHDDADSAGGSDRAAPNRRAGIRQARRVSNWTAAALIVGAGSATYALAHQAMPAATVPPGSASAATGAGGTAGAPGTTGPRVTHSVATTSASGVTTTTTTRTVNGRTVVTHVRHAPAYHDN